MNKAYARTTWENYPSSNTPINETNLNNIEVGLNEVDDRVITLDITKATKEEVATTITSVSLDESSGIITFTRKNGTTFTIDTMLEKLAVNFDYNALTQKIVITLDDGSTKEIDLSALITQYEFIDSDTVRFVIGTDGKVSAIVIDGSITADKLEPNYLAQITVQAENAAASASTAAGYANVAAEQAQIATNAANEARNYAETASLKIVNNLDSQDTDKALSAKQGNLLKGYIVILDKASPYTIVINDENKTVNFIDRQAVV